MPAWRSPAGRRGRLAAAAVAVPAALLLHKNFAVLSAAIALLLLSKRLVCVGLTGGIAAGKSAVAEELRQQGAVVIDADVVARDVVEPGTPALTKLVRQFGSAILNEDGTLNRKRLREIMIDDRSARRFINGVTHPAIAWETLKRVATHRWLGGKLVVIDAALLFESGLFLQLLCSPIICVTAPTPLRIERVIARDHVSAEDAAGVIAAQMPQDRKAALSHITIENAGTAEQLRQRVREVVQLL
jgi:dephospho-CoA kinase